MIIGEVKGIMRPGYWKIIHLDIQNQESGSEPGDKNLPKITGKDLGLHKLLHYGGIE